MRFDDYASQPSIEPEDVDTSQDNPITLGGLPHVTTNAKHNRTEHFIAGLNLESDSIYDVISRFGKPNSRSEAPGDFGPNDTAVSHSEWIFDTYSMFISGWWFPKTKEREWILGVRLEGETCPSSIHTGAGITLGSTYQQVVDAYGLPNWDGEFGFQFQDGYSLLFGLAPNKLVNRLQLMVPMIIESDA